MAIQILEDNTKPSTSQMFGQAFANAGQGIGQGIPQFLMGQQEKKKLVNTENQMRSFADQLELNNPGSPMHQTVAAIYRSGLPEEHKTNLVKELVGIDPYKADQQKRLQQDLYAKTYNAKIREIDNDLKTAKSYANPGEKSERQILQARKKQIQKERDQLLELREEENEEELKPAFDQNNPEHKAKAIQLYNQFKDKKKVAKELSKEFSGF